MTDWESERIIEDERRILCDQTIESIREIAEWARLLFKVRCLL